MNLLLSITAHPIATLDSDLLGNLHSTDYKVTALIDGIFASYYNTYKSECCAAVLCIILYLILNNIFHGMKQVLIDYIHIDTFDIILKHYMFKGVLPLLLLKCQLVVLLFFLESWYFVMIPFG